MLRMDAARMCNETFWPISVATVTSQRQLRAAKVRIATPLTFNRHVLLDCSLPVAPGESCLTLAILVAPWSFVVVVVFVAVVIVVVVDLVVGEVLVF